MELGAKKVIQGISSDDPVDAPCVPVEELDVFDVNSFVALILLSHHMSAPNGRQLVTNASPSLA